MELTPALAAKLIETFRANVSEDNQIAPQDTAQKSIKARAKKAHPDAGDLKKRV